MQSKDPDQTKNVLLAVVLSIAVLFAWEMLYSGPLREAERERQARIQAETSQTQVGGQPTVPGVATRGLAPTDGTATASGSTTGLPNLAIVDRATALATDQRVIVRTPSVIGSINLKGARIDDITLVKYHVSPDQSSPRVILFSPANAPGAYFADLNWRAGGATAADMPGPNTVWSVKSGSELTPENPIELTWDNGKGLTFSRKLAVDADYMFTVEDTVTNGSAGPVVLFPSGVIFRYGVPQIEGFFIQHEGLIGVLGENEFTEISYSGAMEEGGGKTVQGASGGWLGFTDKYWAASLIPDQTKPFNASLDSISPLGTPTTSNQFAASYASQAMTVAAGSSTTATSHLYVGAKKVDLIEQYQETLKIRQFELMIDWGWFYFITKPLYYLLDYLYKMLGNFGFAILAVTVFVKALFFWFANKSYESMAKMKKMQPAMEKIRERFKNDKPEQQKALMELYRTEKINPLAGCLPVLIQIPVFFALYKVLFISIDMRHAPFVGWIKDLSAPDPTSIFNLFGLIPYTPPEWLPLLGICPVFMGITMWLQMQLNPQQPDPTQQMIFNWMPVLFTFLLASFPAGLVIYWAWNNVLSLGQQYLIMKRQGVDVHLLSNIRKTASAAKGVGGLMRRPGSGGGSSDGAAPKDDKSP